VIDPDESRRVLLEALALAPRRKKPRAPAKRHGISPI